MDYWGGEGGGRFVAPPPTPSKITGVGPPLPTPMQRIHMKNQVLFSSKDKSKKLKCCLLQFLFGALRVSVKMQ